MIDTNKQYTPPAKYQAKKFNPNKKPAKVPGFTVASFLVLLAVFFAKYFLDFLLLPLLFPDIYPFSVAAIVIWVVETIIFLVVSIKFITGFGYFYIAAALVYAIPIAIYSNELFGFGTVIPTFVGALIAYAATRFLERIIMWIFIGISFITM